VQPEGGGLVHRDLDDQIVSGLAAGIAHRLGIEPIYVRAAFVVFALVWGFGVIAYLAGWAATSGPQVPAPPAHPSASRGQRIGLAMIGAGALLTLRAFGLWPGNIVVWPSAAVVFGAAFLLDQREVDSRAALLRMFDPNDGRGRSRTFIGVVLLIIGLSLFGSAAVPEIGAAMVAVVVSVVGLTLVFGPWIWRLAGDLGSERRERIRQEERAEMAAHLHDSVLQTLALIQRTDEPRKMVTLARAQERELRKWLYDRAPETGEERLTDALQAAADRIEEDFDIPVEVVSVGEAPLTDRFRALAAAAGEALTNAAKHAGADRISIYMESTEDTVEVFVTDQGTGFDKSRVNGDRRGIADSIEARMARHGGTAEIFSAPGEGTEVHLTMPREA
jgi:signal transduction histidine kinase/phage shock protein PspC (stress-responsive transcriptional regulator)